MVKCSRCHKEREQNEFKKEERVYKTCSICRNKYKNERLLMRKGAMLSEAINIIKKGNIISYILASSLSKEIGSNAFRVSSHLKVCTLYEDCTCSICMEDLCKGEEVYDLACNHKFHKHCLLLCISCPNKDNILCPLCRRPILEEKISFNFVALDEYCSDIESFFKKVRDVLD